MNPYASTLDPHRYHDLGHSQSWSILLTLLGMTLSCLAFLGTCVRIVSVYLYETTQWATQLTRVLEVAPLIGLAVFALTACLLLMILVRSPTGSTDSRAEQPATELRFSQLFVVVATIAMLARTLSEPNTAWTPHWPAYFLTFSAGIAMAMVWLRLRKSTTPVFA